MPRRALFHRSRNRQGNAYREVLPDESHPITVQGWSIYAFDRAGRMEHVAYYFTHTPLEAQVRQAYVLAKGRRLILSPQGFIMIRGYRNEKGFYPYVLYHVQRTIDGIEVDRIADGRSMQPDVVARTIIRDF